MSGADSVWNFSIGGTGWATANSFANRVLAILACNPDEVFILGCVNDGNANVQSAADAILSDLSSVPNVYVFGPPNPALTTQIASLSAACAAAGRPFFDTYVRRADVDRYIGSEDIHPTFAGHKRLATGVYEAYMQENAI